MQLHPVYCIASEEVGVGNLFPERSHEFQEGVSQLIELR